MKNLIVILACAFINTAQAQEVVNVNKTMKCSDAQFIINNFINNYGENPVWVGTTVNKTQIVLLENKINKTWTILEYNPSVACVISVGESGSNTDTLNKNNL